MGLYDTVKCKYPLPVPNNIDLSEFNGKPIEELVLFQTKNLGRHMSNYEIREDGSLWVEKYDLEFDSVGEYCKRQNRTWVPYFLHNDVIEIYELYSPYDEKYQNTTKNDYWMRYSVTFTSSIVSEIRLLEFVTRDRTEHERRLDELFGFIRPSFGVRFVEKSFKLWRQLTSWIPNSRQIEYWIISKIK